MTLRHHKQFNEFAKGHVYKAQRVDPDAPPRWLPLADNPEQTRAYQTTADETFFGGMAGSGKSALLVGMGLTRHRKSLILRRQATQLPEITSYLRECMVSGDKFAQVGHGARVVTFDGRRIELSGCDTIADAQKYKGRAHDFKGWDEASDFLEWVFRFVNIWNRTTARGQRCRVLAASNPPTTAEGEWVIRYWSPWIDPQAGKTLEPGELGWFIRDPELDRDRLVDGPDPVRIGSELIRPKSRTFIPGKMVTMLEESGYRAALQMMPEELRDVYLKGDFRAAKRDHEFQLIRSQWVKEAIDRGCKQDWRHKEGPRGYCHPVFTPLTCLGVDPAGGGVDECSMAPAYGRDIGPIFNYRGKETGDGELLATRILWATSSNPAVTVRLDVTGGYGNEALGRLTRGETALRTVDPVSFGTATTFRDESGLFTFQDLRSAMWWNLRQMLDPEGKADHELLTLPDDAKLFADLTAPRFRRLPGNVIQVEPKQSRQGISVSGSAAWGIKDRLGRSTDRGDAVVMACWPGETAAPAFGWVSMRQDTPPPPEERLA